jgi:hypothetical protein
LSPKRFLTPRGIKVLKSEFTWVILPSLCFAASMTFFRIIKKYCKT